MQQATLVYLSMVKHATDSEPHTVEGQPSQHFLGSLPALEKPSPRVKILGMNGVNVSIST